MENREMFSWLSDLSKDDAFEQCLVLTDRAKEEQYDMDLALRFVVFRTLDTEEVKKAKDINEFITDKMLEIARRKDFDFEEESAAFRATFFILNKHVGADCFHRFDVHKQRFLGGFLLSAFEAVALGVGYNYKDILSSTDEFDIVGKIKELWANKEFLNRIGSGKTASLRMPKIVPLARNLFKP
jgi:hypothetical protein